MKSLFFILPLLTFVSSQHEESCGDGTIVSMDGICQLDQTKCDLIENAYNGCCEATENSPTMDEISNNHVHFCGTGTAFDNNALSCIPNSRQNKKDCEALKAAFKIKCCEMHSGVLDGSSSDEMHSDVLDDSSSGMYSDVLDDSSSDEMHSDVLDDSSSGMYYG